MRKPPQLTTVDADITVNDKWARKTITGYHISHCFYDTVNQKYYSEGMWRIHGEAPYSNCRFGTKFYRDTLRLMGKSVIKPKQSFSRIKNVIAGPFKKNELGLAEKMLLSHPNAEIIRKKAGYFIAEKRSSN